MYSFNILTNRKLVFEKRNQASPYLLGLYIF